MTNRLLTLAVVGAVGAGSAASIATARDGGARTASARTQIATISSYASGVLTLRTSGGAEVTAKVTRRTRIACLPLSSTGGTTPSTTTPAETTPTGTTPDYPTRRGPRGGDDQAPGGRGAGRGERLHRGEESDGGSDAVCDTSSLTAGAGVLAAATELTTSGQRFTKLVLVDTSTTTESAN